VACFIATQRDTHRVSHAVACRALGVSQAWFYKWRHGDASPRHARREQLKVAIGRWFAQHHGTYGSPRLTADLRDEGWQVSKNTVAQLMAELGLHARRKRRRKQTTRQSRGSRGKWRAQDLIRRDFATNRLNRKWYGDGTEIGTDDGKLYLDSVLDMGSRRIVGFALGEHHDAELAYGAMTMAVAIRGGKDAITGVILHTDSESVLASFPGFLTFTAMDTSGWLVSGAPRVPDPHSDRRRVSCLGSVGALGAAGEALRLAVGVT
jgi:putative transposase